MEQDDGYSVGVVGGEYAFVSEFSESLTPDDLEKIKTEVSPELAHELGELALGDEE